MTINVALVTSEAIVFGCDSTASSITHLLNVFPHMDMNAEPDEEGKFVAKFLMNDLQPVVANSQSGVRKMFEIGTERIPIVAVAAGTAKLVDRTITSLGLEFQQRMRGSTTTSVERYAREFLEFMRGYYDQHYADSPIPEEFREGPEFLVGGIGRRATYPALYRVKVQENVVETEFDRGNGGVSWNGQADAVERIIRGCDPGLRHAIWSQLPDFDFDPYKLGIGYSDLPLQEAVNFVSYLVLVQGGKARFGHGIPTVGGRTHIAVATKENGIQFLNEPELAHRYVGFFDET